MASRCLVLTAVAAVLAIGAQVSNACDVDVCFAMSGDLKTFAAQQGVVGGASYYLSKQRGGKSYSAIQYTTESVSEKGISPREENGKKFSTAMYGAKPNGGMAFPVSGLNYCMSQVVRRRRRPRGAAPTKPRRMVIVFLGPGTRELGSDPVDRAALFARVGGTVFTVGIGGNIKFTDLKDISRSWWRTLPVTKSPWETGLELGRRICL